MNIHTKCVIHTLVYFMSMLISPRSSFFFVEQHLSSFIFLLVGSYIFMIYIYIVYI